jgi:methylated-DNA-[protein]-cysteine S-methyltransferase
MNLFYYDTGLGRIGIAESNGRISALYFEGETVPEKAEICETSVLKEAAGQLTAYLAGEQRSFSLPLEPAGTPFMQSVWRALGDIPYGRTVSYKEIAAAVGNPKASRAVGMANNRNPLPIFIPCHRVVGASGALVGYGGGLDIKVRLLEIEKQNL